MKVNYLMVKGSRHLCAWEQIFYFILFIYLYFLSGFFSEESEGFPSRKEKDFKSPGEMISLNYTSNTCMFAACYVGL
jgi:hypothetical protein